MVRPVTILILAATLVGCGGRSYKVDHPVVGPAPPRVSNAKAMAMVEEEAKARGQSQGVQLTSAGGSSNQPFEMTDVVATVNGKPILVANVLGSARSRMEEARKQVPPAQLRQMQEHAIREQLPAIIERSMMVAVMETKLTTDQAKGVQSQIDKLFEGELENMRARMEKRVGRPCSLADLEADIQSQGMTISEMRVMFGENAIAQQYMMGKLEAEQPIGRPELLAAYRERIKEFTEPGAIKWQQIQVSYKNFADKAEARQQAAAALAALQKGTSFDEVARKYSDGPDSANGGHWDWTQYESLLTELQEPLKTLAPKTPSQIIATPNALQIVQVVERREPRTRPFAEVQEQIREELTETRHKAKVKVILDELHRQCVVTTIFDDQKGGVSASPAADDRIDKAFSTNSPEGG